MDKCLIPACFLCDRGRREALVLGIDEYRFSRFEQVLAGGAIIVIV